MARGKNSRRRGGVAEGGDASPGPVTNPAHAPPPHRPRPPAARGVAATPAAAQVAPDERWLTLRTEHFDVHFTPELEALARRAAGHAELARERLTATLTEPPRGRIHVVVSDAFDVANGYASQLPRPRMVLLAHPPVDELRLSAHDEWLDLLVTHELAHLFHLDTADGVWAALRTLFGRTPLSLPQRMTPWWWIEGAATYYETRLTPGGGWGAPTSTW
jgi:hypothetical protein